MNTIKNLSSSQLVSGVPAFPFADILLVVTRVDDRISACGGVIDSVEAIKSMQVESTCRVLG